MARIDSSNIATGGRVVTHIRLDRIGATEAKELWWVALAFDDESTKPEGMFGDYDTAATLATELGSTWGVEVIVTKII